MVAPICYQLSRWLRPTTQLCYVLERHRSLTHMPNCVVLKLSIWAGKFCWFGIFKLYTCLPSSWGCLNVQVVDALALPFYKYSIIVGFFLGPTSRKLKNSILKIIVFRRTAQYLCYRHSHKLGWVEVCLAPGLWDRGQTWHVSRWWIVRIALPNHFSKILVLCASALHLFGLLFEVLGWNLLHLPFCMVSVTKHVVGLTGHWLLCNCSCFVFIFLSFIHFLRERGLGYLHRCPWVPGGKGTLILAVYLMVHGWDHCSKVNS